MVDSHEAYCSVKKIKTVCEAFSGGLNVESRVTDGQRALGWVVVFKELPVEVISALDCKMDPALVPDIGFVGIYL